MLAGRMKLKNFLLIVGAVGAAGIAGLSIALSSGSDSPGQTTSPAALATASFGTKTPVAPQSMTVAALPEARPLMSTESVPQATQADVTRAVQAAGGAGASAMRPADEMMMSFRGKALGDSKRKDASPGKPFKINLYQDDGHSQVNRAKLDLDRDDKWDEKWTFDGDRVSRKVAPADDENYTESYVWDGAGWVKE